jgi:hypothetical protein
LRVALATVQFTFKKSVIPSVDVSGSGVVGPYVRQALSVRSVVSCWRIVGSGPGAPVVMTEFWR